MKNLLKKILIEILIFINHFIPKQKVNNRVLIFCNMGIGDLVMLMSVIKILIEHNYDVTALTKRSVNREILSYHFKGIKLDLNGIYGWSINNFHTVYWKEILTIFRYRIPNRVAHEHYIYSKFFNRLIKFDFYVYQPDMNLLLLKQLGIKELESLYFKKPLKEYVLIQPFSYTDRRKECMPINEILSKNENIIVIGHKSEYKDLLGVINMIGKTDIIHTSELIALAKHFYCLESGLAHIAAAIGTPTTVYYRKGISKEHALHRQLKHMTYVEII